MSDKPESVAGSESTEDSVSTTDADAPAPKKKKRKKVSWKDEANLRSYHYFEMDETERGQFCLILHMYL